MASKKAFLIDRALSAAETNGFLAVLRENEAEVYLHHPHPELEQAGARRWNGLEVDAAKALHEQLLKTLNDLGHQQLGNNTITGSLQYDGFTVWYYHKFRIYYGLQAKIQQLESYRRLANQFDQLIVYVHSMPEPLLLGALPTVLFVPPAEGDAGGTSPQSTTYNSKGIAQKGAQLRKMVSRFWQGFSKSFQKQEALPRHLFVLNHQHLKPILDPDHLPERYLDNVFVAYFLREYGHQFVLLDKLLFEKNSPADRNKEYDAQQYFGRNLLFNEWIEWKAALNPKVYIKLWRYHKHLKKVYSQIKRANLSNLEQVLVQEYVKLHSSSLFFFFLYQAYRKFFRQHQFISVSLLDEYSPNFRLILDAARREGVRTQSIQHGSLASTNPGYAYSLKDKPFHPWPDRSLVWGQFWKELLVRESAYAPESIFITGQIRTDIIPKLEHTPLSVAEILGPEADGKFRILFATQPQPNEQLRQQAALDVFAVAREMPQSWVLVKLHPRETQAEYYHALARQAGCSNYTIYYDTELFLMLRLSHVLVHCYSTVGIEAVNFGLPAIILDYLKQDLMGFAAEGVALQAQNAAQLNQGLIDIRAGVYGLDKEKAQAYIQKYTCAIDGLVSYRTAQALLAEGVEAELPL